MHLCYKSSPNTATQEKPSQDLHKISKHSESRNQTSVQATEIIKKCKFEKILTTVVNVPPLEKFAMTVIGKTILRSAVHVIKKTLHEIEQTETESPSAGEYEFFLDMINLHKSPENLVNISQIKNEPSDWNITLSSNGIPISYKIDTGAQCDVIPVESLEENISPKP